MATSKNKSKIYSPDKLWVLLEVTYVKNGLTYRYPLPLSRLTNEIEANTPRWIINVLTASTSKFAIKKYLRSLVEHEKKGTRSG